MAKRATIRKQTVKRGSSVRRAGGKKTSSKRVTSAAVKRKKVRATSVTSKRKKPRATLAAKRKTAARGAATRARTKRTAPKPSRLSTATALVRGAAASAVVAVTERLPWAKDEDDPIVLLERDHRRFEDWLKRGEQTTERAVKSRTQLLETLTAALNVHEMIEEKLLYPALEPYAQAREIVLEGYQEHHVADVLLSELHALAKDDEAWGAKFKVLKESVEHHIGEEERVMFRTARSVLSRDELRDLGARMKTLKAELER